MATVDTQPNPTVYSRGTKDADAVIISSDIVVSDSSRKVLYQIVDRKADTEINVDSGMAAQEGGNIVDVTTTALKIILPFRTTYSVRVKHTPGGTWSAWVSFTTRDKRYSTPDAITQLTDDTDSTAATNDSGSRTIVVTNSAHATENEDQPVEYGEKRLWGNVTVQNADPIYSDGQIIPGTGRLPIEYTARGATVVNTKAGKDTQVVYTNAGATITTNP